MRAVTLVVLLAAVVVVAIAGGLPHQAEIEGWLASAGPAAPILFVILYAAITLFPVPKNLLGVLGGLLFGMGWGLLLVWGAAMVGAAAAFWIGRVLGREAVEQLTGARVSGVDELLRRHGLLSVIAVRLVPVLPFTAINYSAGLTAVSVRAYLVGTAIGILPGTVAYVALGAYMTDLGSWPIIAAVTVLVALSVGGVLAARQWRQGRTEGPT